MNPSRPKVLFSQKHWDAMRSDDAGDSWREVSGNLPTDFGFVIDVHAHEPETIYVPIENDREHYPPEGKLRVYRSRSGGYEWEPLKKACRRNIAMSMYCAMPWSWTLWTNATPISAQRVGRSTHRLMQETTGHQSFALFRPCFPWRSSRSLEPADSSRDTSTASADAGQDRCRCGTRSERRGHLAFAARRT
jgi:hypothetical protein